MPRGFASASPARPHLLFRKFGSESSLSEDRWQAPERSCLSCQPLENIAVSQLVAGWKGGESIGEVVSFLKSSCGRQPPVPN